MPYVVQGRGIQQYDNQGNFWGYFPTGFNPPCSAVTSTAELNKNCPVGAIDCRRVGFPTCKTNYTCKFFNRAQWTSCSSDTPILF